MIGLQERGALCAAPVTLDGRPACICGRLEAFGIVATVHGSARAEFAWSTIARIVANGGRFKS